MPCNFGNDRLLKNDPSTWQDYLAICRIGGSKTFLETVQLGHLASPFDQEKMSRLLTAVDDYLSQISETELR